MHQETLNQIRKNNRYLILLYLLDALHPLHDLRSLDVLHPLDDSHTLDALHSLYALHLLGRH